MEKIFTLCFHLFLLFISDADPLKLIAGDRSVVKKDGATHTISKYYVVPNNYDPNNTKNNSEISQKTALHMRSLYSKSVGSGSIGGEITKDKEKTVNDQSDSDLVAVGTINTPIDNRSQLKMEQGGVNQNDDATDSTVSVKAITVLDSHNLETDGKDSSDNSEEEVTKRREISDEDNVNDLVTLSAIPVSKQDKDDNKDALRSLVQNKRGPETEHTISDTTETTENLDNLLDSLDPRFTGAVPPGMTIDSRIIKKLPWLNNPRSIESSEVPIWTIQDKGSVTSRQTDDLPWYIEDRPSFPPHKINQNSDYIGPWNINRGFLSALTSGTGGKLLIKPNQIKKSIHSVKNGIKKPYHIYTYVINPSKITYEVPNAISFQTKLFGLPSQGGNQEFYKNQPSQKYYERQINMEKSPVKHTNYITRPEVNALSFFSQSSQEDNIPVYLVRPGSEPKPKPALILPNSEDVVNSNNFIQQNSHPPVTNTASAHSSVQINQPNGFISSSASSSANADNSNEPVYVRPIAQQPGSFSTASVHSFIEPAPVYEGNYPGLVHPIGVDDKPAPAYEGDSNIQPGFISKATADSSYINVPNHYDVPTNGNEKVNPGPILNVHQYPVYPNGVYNNDKPIPAFEGDSNIQPGFISKATAHTTYTNVPTNYNEEVNPGPIFNVHKYPVYPNGVYNNDKQIPAFEGDSNIQPGFISKATAHTTYKNVPNYYDIPNNVYEENHVSKNVEVNQNPVYPNVVNEQNYPGYISKDIFSEHILPNNFKIPTNEYEKEIDVTQSSLIKHVPSTENLKLAPTYRLLTLNNLQKVRNAVIKTIQLNGPGVDNGRALANLNKILEVILILAESFEKTDRINPWYERIFYNPQLNEHPLQLYVYHLIRQRWLHELMLLLYKNNFSVNVLENPKIFSFLETWQIPNYVQNFLETWESTHGYNTDTKLIHTFDDVIEELPKDLEEYVTKSVIDSYKSSNDIVLSIAGVEAEPDASAIIHMLQEYLKHKTVIEKQQNVLIGDNKVEMLKHVVLFLRQKGYDSTTIANLVKKLYSAVYSVEGGCHTLRPDFAKSMYNVIVPALRRSG